MLADGLSPRALTDHGAALLAALVAELRPTLSLAPPVIAVQARVALADHLLTGFASGELAERRLLRRVRDDVDGEGRPGRPGVADIIDGQ